MKEETSKYIELLMTEHYFTNPSAITSCIFMKELEPVQQYELLRKNVLKEMDRISKKLKAKAKADKETNNQNIKMKESNNAYYRILKTAFRVDFFGHRYVVQRKRKRGILRFWWNTTEWDTVEEAQSNLRQQIAVDNGAYDYLLKDQIL